MLADISPLWIAVLNSIYFTVVMVGVGWIVTHLPESWFEPHHWIFKTWKIEIGLYEKMFFIRSWKHCLPDGSKMYAGGFSKKKLTRKDAGYIRQFSSETCRGEFAHWIDLTLLPLVVIWNPSWAIVVMVSLGLLGNIPCILSQRYNRARIMRIKV